MFTIAIISQKGGAGKTTLAVHLATEASAAGYDCVIVDADPQATASSWFAWREAENPEVYDCASPPLLGKKLAGYAEHGVDLSIIDTPPHADVMSREACRAADLILIPCRPRAFDLDAVRTTAELASASGKPAFVIFMGGPVRAPNVYSEAGELIRRFGLKVAAVMMPERAAFHHSVGVGKTAREIEPSGKAAEDVAALWRWAADTLGIAPAKSPARAPG
jgi:chromosome partitioning protein